MILASHQPDFLPYMGLFYKAARCDTFVFSDDVLFSKKGMHNWNRIKTPLGEKKLTVPVHSHHDLQLCEIMVADIRRSIAGVVKTVDQNYRRAPHYDEGSAILSVMSSLAVEPRLRMVDLNLRLTLYIMDRFAIRPRILIASDNLHLTGRKDERIFSMCEETGADVYLSGRGAADYHQAEEYLMRGIDLTYTDYRPVEYEQIHGAFIPNLSVIDYIFNCGFELPRGWKKE